MKTLVISDIHGNYDGFPPNKLPDADLVLFAGDLTERGVSGAPEALWLAEQWLRAMAGKYPQVISIPGNHDIGFRQDTFPEIAGIQWIQNKTISLRPDAFSAPITIHGVNMSPSYLMPELVSELDFMTADEAVEAASYNFEPVTIVLSHAPPFGILDVEGEDALTNEPVHIGSQALLRYIQQFHPRFVICGHVHAAKGFLRVELDGYRTDVHNVAQTYRLLTI